ncbi:MAG: histidinol-phosphatase HisJ family protein [Candidatus Heimdallarchaeota archaeon]|nr:histidinol-phosphatase HisJ family protein [Candidatus Heimdallarchaeota archaeon]
MVIDWHVHTLCSCDSSLHPIEACEMVLEKGLKGLCFVDHIDFDPRDEGIDYFNWLQYLDLIEEARTCFPQIIIKTGFELNWQRDYQAQILEFLADKKVDFIIGSIHWLSTGYINSAKTYSQRTFGDFINEWCVEALSLLRSSICQGFAHFDYFFLQTKQLYPNIKREDIFEWTEEVVDAMIKYDVSLEINTSSLRKGLREPFPCWDFIERYLKKGGTKVYLGSDSHTKEAIGFSFDQVLTRLKQLTYTFQLSI